MADGTVSREGVRGINDVDVRARAAALRAEGLLGRPATPPPQMLTLGGREPYRAPAAPPVPREIVELRAVESVETLPPPGRVEGMRDALELADKCRTAASMLDALAANSREYEASALKRLSHGIVRALFAEVSGRVVLCLALACAAVGCGGSADPEPAKLPIAQHCYMHPDNASYVCDGRPDQTAAFFWASECIPAGLGRP